MNTITQYTENKLDFISIVNNQTNFKITLCDLGASLYEVWFDDKLMTVQVEDSNAFALEDIRFGKTIGRVSGRIANSMLDIDGKVYRFETNNYNNCLHSGHHCLAQAKFKLLDLKNDSEKTTIVYQYLSPDLEGGFPGNVTVTITYVISAVIPEVKIIFNAISDKKTPISLTNHAYYSLGDENISNLNLCIKADKYLDTSVSDKLPTKVVPIKQCFNFNEFKNILKDINDPIINTGVKHGYDNFFYFSNKDENQPKIQLENKLYHLDIYTDFEGTMVYTNNTPKLNVKCKRTNQRVRKGIAIEPQEDQLKNHIVEANKPIEHWIKIQLKKK